MQKEPSLSANAHHVVTDFKFHEILRNKAAHLKAEHDLSMK